MHKGLQEYFPQIRTRKEVLKDICIHPECLRQFELWSQESCTGKCRKGRSESCKSKRRN